MFRNTIFVLILFTVTFAVKLKENTRAYDPSYYGCARLKLKSWKGDYLHRPDTNQGVTTWSSGLGNEWNVEWLRFDIIQLKSWKGDYLHRPDTDQGVTTWNSELETSGHLSG